MVLIHMKMESKLQTEDESTSRGVSPVIGVILMVAVTVILAAVIAAFVLDLGGSLSSEAQGSVSVSGNDTTSVTVTAESLANADGIAVIDPTDDGSVVSDGDGDADLRMVGTEVTLTDTAGEPGSGTYHVIAYNGNSASPDDRTGENIIETIEVASD
ncbi:type IV pilin [Natrialbaceae archaeon A-CW1-1]